MPGGAPQAMQMPWMNLQFAKSDPSKGIGNQMQALGKSLKDAGVNQTLNPPTPQDVAPGASVPGGAGPIAAGGPQGPAPLPGQQALPGSPYSPQAGSAAPPILTPQQASPQLGQPQLPTAQVPYPQPSPVQAFMQNNPFQQLNLLRSALAGGGGAAGGMMPGTAALSGAGMLPGAGVLPGSQGFGG
jgi:hypothetical protein